MFEANKITDTEIAQYGVQSAADTLKGTPAQNKAKFDNLIQQVVKVHLNNLIDDLSRAGAAAELGLDIVPGLEGCTNLQDALESIVEQMQEITQGSVADASITTQKLYPYCVDETRLASSCIYNGHLTAGCVTTAKLDDGAVTGEKLNSSVDYTDIGLTANQVRKITYGTDEPSGGVVGDLYVQYFASEPARLWINVNGIWH